MEHILERAGGLLPVAPQAVAAFYARLAEGPVRSRVFSAYYDLVPAIEADRLDEAAALLDEMLAAPAPGPGIEMRGLGDPDRDPAAARCERILASDPTAPFAIRPPPREVSEACRARLADALRLLDASDPDMAAEFRALVREIILAVGPERDEERELGGAVSFALWGAIVLNPTACPTPVAAVRALAHEGAHSLLFGLGADDLLIENAGPELYASPLRNEDRPLEGTYHATFVIARMHRAVRRLADSGVLHGADLYEARHDLATLPGLFASGLATLERHGRFTARGAAVLDGARAYMAAAG